MNFSKPNQVVVSNRMYQYYTFEEFALTVESLGYTHVDLEAMPPHIWISDRGIDNLDDVQAVLKAHKLIATLMTVDSTTNRYMINAAEDSRRESSLRYYANCLNLCQELGINMLAVQLQGAWRDEPQKSAFKRAVDSVMQLCRLAESNGVKICVEPLCMCEGPLFTTMAQMSKLIAEVSHPLLHVALDLVQINDSGESLEQWFEAFGPQIALVRFCDARAGKAHLIPGEGVLPMDGFWHKLREVGYDGLISTRLTNTAYFQNPFEIEKRNRRMIGLILGQEEYI